MAGSKSLLDVLNGTKPDRRPVWLMRQAGRYLPEYREVRKQAGSFLNLCYTPNLAAEVTLQPLRRYDLDAAILFADILVVPDAMGLTLDFVENEGPVLQRVGDLADVKRLGAGVGSSQFANVFETVSRVRDNLPARAALIGFCGAPWTVASYMIEGRGSARAGALDIAVSNPAWFALLMERLAEVSIQYLLGQIAAGAQVVQIFDSWAGDVPKAARERVVTGPIRRMVEGVREVHPGFPVIVFARGIADGHDALAESTGASAVSVEQGVDLKALLAKLPSGVAVQGNLAPELLLEDDVVVRKAVLAVIEGVPVQRHIFNLGHGIVPQVLPEKVSLLLETIRNHDAEVTA